MPIIYLHEMQERNPKLKVQPKYRKNTWVIFNGKHCQVKGFTLQDGVPIYTLKLPTRDGFGELLTVHQRDIKEGTVTVITELDRQANRDRVIAEEKSYKRD